MIDRYSNQLRATAAYQAALLLPTRPRRKMALLVLVQFFLGTLDLLAVALAGLLGTLAIANAQSESIGRTGTIGRVLSALRLDQEPVGTQIFVLALVTAALFVSRTVTSIYLTRRALHFLGVRAALASADLVERLLRQPITFLQTRSTQEFIFSTTASTNALIIGVLGAIVVMAADASMLVALGALMLYASPFVAVAAGMLLGCFVAVLHRFTTARAQQLGEAAARHDVHSRDLLTEAIATYRDMQVRGAQPYYANASRNVRLDAAAATAEWAFLPNVSKYVLESAVILGALVIGGLELAVDNVQRAVGVLALFMAAGTRLAPAIIRLQQAATTLRWSAGQGAHALRLQSEMPDARAGMRDERALTTDHEGFEASIQFSEVCFTYPGTSHSAVEHLTWRAQPGTMIALVGPSGAGKSTVADLLLGVLDPSGGAIRISGREPRDAAESWPGAIAYVPQDVWIADGSVRKNVALGFDPAAVPDSMIWNALEAARLADVVNALQDGLDAQVGERGAKLSGGQRQRLGIARALLTEPQLLVLDEATSALDASTEHDVSEAIRGLHGRVTVVVIAHRLATVRHADQVLYMDEGRVRAAGTFDEVRATAPHFERQATLLGL